MVPQSTNAFTLNVPGREQPSVTTGHAHSLLSHGALAWVASAAVVQQGAGKGAPAGQAIHVAAGIGQSYGGRRLELF